ncbi:NAD(P)-binding Rossmann-fold superfamily protein [Tasmannia lanceolata]|uniref:NAD(P)-binding Rossmann-fold superfamily protein n=1 Tax=Tasmannia lanceolata TaxID=3420 RepID=UPI004063FFE6
MAGEYDSTLEAAPNVALIIGVTGLAGKELARTLSARPNWKVYGVARKLEVFPFHLHHYQFISCDVLDPIETLGKLSLLEDVTHFFWVTWATQFPLDTQDCCDQNKAMLSNVLNAILPTAKALKHVSLQTGTKHYISLSGPFDGEARYYDEESPRITGGCNFYYALEDLLKERLTGKVGWSVHRPGLILGNSRRTVFNFMGSLCVYGTICKHLGLPFVFGGSRMCWEEAYLDMSDARLVARQQMWASTNDHLSSANGEAFNTINGPCFTWKEIWPTLAAKFRVEAPKDMFSPTFLFSDSMADKGKVWEEIVEREGLCGTNMDDLANWWFLDTLFRCPTKILVSRSKANRHGFTTTFETLDSILYWVDCMRDEKLIP